MFRVFISIAVLTVGSQFGFGAAIVDRLPAGDDVHEGKEAELCGRVRAPAVDARMGGGAAMGEERGFDVIHYDLAIELSLEYAGGRLDRVLVTGTNTIDAESTIDGLSEVYIDLRDNMLCRSVTGNVQAFDHADHKINVTLDGTYNPGDAFQIVVSYDGYPESGGFDAFKWWERNGNPVIGTLSEPFYARYWWPCKDELDDKATMRTHVTVPNPLVVGSNGVLEGVDEESGDRSTYRWHESYPMIPYLASLAVTNYQVYELVYEYDDGGSQTMPVVAFLYPDHWDFDLDRPRSGYKEGCDEMVPMLGDLAGLYGEYPFVAEKYGVAETGGSGGLGANMEHQTLSSMWRVNGYSDIMCHEMAHQWWGDDVTCQTWHDIWLNEGFASYSESLYREVKQGGGMDSFWSRVNARRPSNPDAKVYRDNIDSVWDIFDGNAVYNKGSWVLHMLRGVMGDAAFFDVLGAYRSAHHHDSATTEEFVQTVSQSFGHDLSFFTDQWVMSAGSPDYDWNAETRMVGGVEYVALGVWQRQNSDGFGLFTMPIDMRVTTAEGEAVETIWNDAWEEFYVFPVAGSRIDIQFDEEGGRSDRNWVLFDSKTRIRLAIEGPPVVVTTDADAFAGIGPGLTVIAIEFSEDIGSFDSADVGLVGESSGAHAPADVSYDDAAQQAIITFQNLPSDRYALTVFDDAIIANDKMLDGEITDDDWWDHRLLPSGDGQPGGDAVIGFTKQIGDGDNDGLVTLADLPGFVDCMTGPDGSFDPDCAVFDFDFDGNIDLGDFTGFQLVLGTE